MFCETRALAEEWTYRYLAAARTWADEEGAARSRMGLPEKDPEPSTAQVRAWARDKGMEVPQRGRLKPEVHEAWRAAHRALKTC